MKREITYLEHPISKARKMELNAAGFQVVDIKFAPPGWVAPDAPKPEADADRPAFVSVQALREALTAKGIEIPQGAKKAELQALLDAA